MRREYRLLAIATVIGSLIACGGGSSPTAPTNANVTGSYDLTITASSTCAANLPAETRMLTYIATVTQNGAAVQVTLQAHVLFNSVTISGTVSGQSITFSTFSVSEITTGDGIAVASTGSGSVAANGSITGTLNGTFQTPSGTSCNAGNHQIQMVKR